MLARVRGPDLRRTGPIPRLETAAAPASYEPLLVDWFIQTAAARPAPIGEALAFADALLRGARVVEVRPREHHRRTEG